MSAVAAALAINWVAQLRHVHEREPARPRHLLTEPGVGYRFVRG